MVELDYKPTKARNLLFLLLATLIILAGVIAWFRIPLQQIYFREQITASALTLNGLIIGLFLIGIIRLAILLWNYWQEEVALARFITFLRKGRTGQSPDINPRSLIAKRYVSLVNAHRQGMTPNHAALSQIMVAEENFRGNTPKYVNNILILTGVFGTIVSLSIALFGTSSLIEGSGDGAEGINLVVHGMSTALSTTMTAIICYVIFGFFFLRTNLIRTRVLAVIEKVTSEYLIPRFRIKSENITEEVAKLIDSLQAVSKGMLTVQDEQRQQHEMMQKVVSQHEREIAELNKQLADIQTLLKRGFRLNS